MTPLHLAASVGHHNIVTFFLDKFKVDVLSRGRVKYNFDHLAVNNDFSRKRLLCILRASRQARGSILMHASGALVATEMTAD